RSSGRASPNLHPYWDVQRPSGPSHSYDSAMTAFRSTDAARRTGSKQSPGRLLRSVPLGPFETNCYLYAPSAAAGAPCWIIDAGLDPGPLIEAVRATGLKPEKLILTHAHLD